MDRRTLHRILAIALLALGLLLAYSSVRESSGEPAQVDIVFLIDATGSMGDEIEAVRAEVRSFADQLAMEGVDYRLGLVFFRDHPDVPGWASSGDFLVRDMGVTSSVEEFKSWVGQVEADGGGDDPEAILDALDTLLTSVPWRPGAIRVGVLISDSIPHDPTTTGETCPRGLTLAEEIPRLRSAGITVFVLSYPHESMEDIARETGGTFFTFGSGLDVAQILRGSLAREVLRLVPAAHYGSRASTLLALPLAFFMPVVERTVTRTLVKTVLRREVPRVRAGLEVPRVEGEVPRVGRGYGHWPPQPPPPPPAPASAQTLPGGPQQGWVVCPRCGYANRPGARFCVRCGYRLA